MREESHTREVEARVQDLLEAVDNEPLPRKYYKTMQLAEINKIPETAKGLAFKTHFTFRLEFISFSDCPFMFSYSEQSSTHKTKIITWAGLETEMQHLLVCLKMRILFAQ
jgi:hypothetical protein